jgi:hypothetical protein
VLSFDRAVMPRCPTLQSHNQIIIQVSNVQIAGHTNAPMSTLISMISKRKICQLVTFAGHRPKLATYYADTGKTQKRRLFNITLYGSAVYFTCNDYGIAVCMDYARRASHPDLPERRGQRWAERNALATTLPKIAEGYRKTMRRRK